MNGVFVIMIATMPRCLHMFDSGFQCISESLESTDFCEAHQRVVLLESERLQDAIWRKMLLRFVALVLLLMFLIPLFYTLRDLYLGPPAKAQEVW
jgi:hypothetical protein